jgi:hypothetical protein
MSARAITREDTSLVCHCYCLYFYGLVDFTPHISHSASMRGKSLRTGYGSGTAVVGGGGEMKGTPGVTQDSPWYRKGLARNGYNRASVGIADDCGRIGDRAVAVPTPVASNRFGMTFSL